MLAATVTSGNAGYWYFGSSDTIRRLIPGSFGKAPDKALKPIFPVWVSQFSFAMVIVPPAGSVAILLLCSAELIFTITVTSATG